MRGLGGEQWKCILSFNSFLPLSTLKDNPELTVPILEPNFSTSQCHYHVINIDISHLFFYIYFKRKIAPLQLCCQWLEIRVGVLAVSTRDPCGQHSAMRVTKVIYQTGYKTEEKFTLWPKALTTWFDDLCISETAYSNLRIWSQHLITCHWRLVFNSW